MSRELILKERNKYSNSKLILINNYSLNDICPKYINKSKIIKRKWKKLSI